MPITQAMHFTRMLYGDGETKEATIDFADEIQQSKITATEPTEVKDVATDCPQEIQVKSATVAGTKLKIEFVTAPPAKAFNVVGEFLFGETAHKAHKPAHHKS